MRVSYMGIFKIIFNAIFEAILSPIIKFIAKLLSPVISWVFNTILKPILVVVFKWVLPWVADLLKDIFAGILYAIFAYLVKILEYFEKAVDYFAGISKVNISFSTMLNKSQCTLLEAFLYRNEISTIFRAIFVLGFAMSLIFSIISIIKSSLDVDFENKRPVNAVLKSTFRAFLQFLLTNLMVMFIISLSGVILDLINDSFNNLYVNEEFANDYVDESGNIKSYKTSLARIVFCSCTLQAAKDPNINISDDNTTGKVTTKYKGKEQKNYDPLIAGARGEYYNVNSTIDITNLDQAKQYFYLEKIDYFLGAVLTIFLIAIMAMCAITFIQRIFDIIILYIVSPYFVSMIPLDDGEKYKKWKSLFIGKVFSGYGIVISMKVYLLLVPMIVGNNIQFSNESISGVSSGTSIYMLKMIFLIGGAWATMKIGSMITSIIDAGAGQAESETQRMVSSYTGKAVSAGVSLASSAAISTAAFTGRMLSKPIRSAGSNLFGKGGKEIADNKWNAMQGKMEKEFPGKNGGNKSSEGIDVGASGDKSGDSKIPELNIGGGNDSKPSGNGIGGDNKSEGKQGEKSEMGKSISGNKSGGVGEKDKDKESSGDKSLGEGNKSVGEGNKGISKTDSKEGASNKFDGKGKDKGSKSAADHPFKFEGKAKKKNFFDRAAKKVHDIFPQKSNPDGSYSLGLLGFKINYDKNGNRKSISTPFRKLKYDKDGKLHTTKVKIPGLFSVKRSTKTGKFSLASIPAFGVKRVEGKDGEFHLSQVKALGIKRVEGKDGDFHISQISPLGINRVEDSKGEFHMTSVVGIEKGLRYNKETDSYETCGVRIGNMIWGAEEYLDNDSEEDINSNDNDSETNINSTENTNSEININSESSNPTNELHSEKVDGKTTKLSEVNSSGSVINEQSKTLTQKINGESTIVNKSGSIVNKNKELKPNDTVIGAVSNNKKLNSISKGTNTLQSGNLGKNITNNTNNTNRNKNISNNLNANNIDDNTNNLNVTINDDNTNKLNVSINDNITNNLNVSINDDNTNNLNVNSNDVVNINDDVTGNINNDMQGVNIDNNINANISNENYDNMLEHNYQNIDSNTVIKDSGSAIDHKKDDVLSSSISNNKSMNKSIGGKLTKNSTIGKKTLNVKGKLGNSGIINNTKNKLSLNDINSTVSNSNSIINNKESLNLNSSKLNINGLDSNNLESNNLDSNNSELSSSNVNSSNINSSDTNNMNMNNNISDKVNEKESKKKDDNK